jgi:hypothetical protein
MYNGYMDKITIKNENITHALVVITAKEHGKIYEVKDGELTMNEHLEADLPEYSDNEGFFVRSGGGDMYTAGASLEDNDEYYFAKYARAMAEDLSDLLKKHSFDQILVIEPEHYKGRIEENLINPNHIPVEVVTYGNYVQHSTQEIADILNGYKQEEIDPSSPDSVDENEKDAAEKKKILSIGQD